MHLFPIPEGLKEYFGKFGDIAEVMVMKDPTTRRSRGFGFVTFSDPSSVDKVLAHGIHDLDGKKVRSIGGRRWHANSTNQLSVRFFQIDPKVAFPRRAHPKVGTFAKLSIVNVRHREKAGKVERAAAFWKR